MIEQENVINKKSMKEPDHHFQEINKQEQSSLMTDEEDIKTGSSSLKQQLKQLREENKSLKHEKKTLEIDNICLEHKNWELENRIDDLATHYPSASILLGKNPEEYKKKGWIKRMFKK